MEESKDFIWAELASGVYDYAEDYYNYNTVERNVFNLQLRYGIEALMKYQNLYIGNFRVEELLLILNLLCNSLETLAGVNINPTNRTPPFIELYEKTLVNNKVWDLSVEKPDLLSVLKEMDNYNKNLCKHINPSLSRKDLLKEITYEK